MHTPNAEDLRDPNTAAITDALNSIANALISEGHTLKNIHDALTVTNAILIDLHTVTGNATVLIDRILNTR